MSASAIVMMLIGCGVVWGGLFVTITIALSVEKKNKLNQGS